MKRILVLALRAIGDMVLITPVIRALKERHPAASLSLVTEAFAADVFEGNPGISGIIAVDRWARRGLPWWKKVGTDLSWLAEIRERRVDAVVDLFSGPRSAQMALFSGAPVRIAESVRGRRIFYTHTVRVEHAGRHLVEQKMQIAEPLTGKVPIPPLGIFLREAEREAAVARLQEESGGWEGPFVGLFPGAGWGHKRWPPDRFARIGDMLQAQGCRAVILGGPRDVEACREVAEGMAERPVILAGVSRLRDTIALIDRMTLFLSNDTGPMHIAAGLGRPVLGLFGPSDIVKYRPWGPNTHVISAMLPCSPCPQMEDTCHLYGYASGECMRRISVEEVYEKLVEILRARTSDHLTAREGR